MAKSQNINVLAFVFTLSVYQMLSGEARQIRSLNRAKINYHLQPKGSSHSHRALTSSMIDTYISLEQPTEKTKMIDHLEASTRDHIHSGQPQRLSARYALEVAYRKSNHRTADMQKRLSLTALTHDQFFSESATAYQNNFRPTTPGSSPGAGHLEADKIQNMKQCLRDRCTSDFQPMIPRDSKASGHSFLNNSGTMGLEQEGKPLGAAQTHAGEPDDYRPTKPGHSPGAGHAITSESKT